jgi:hypothetical protein
MKTKGLVGFVLSNFLFRDLPGLGLEGAAVAIDKDVATPFTMGYHHEIVP